MLVLEAGSRYDPRGLAGLASLVGRLLLEGSEGMTAAELADAVDSTGSSLDVVTGYETTALMSTGLRERMDESLDILSKLVSLPVFGRAALAESKRRQLSELTEDEDSAFSVCRREFMATVYRGYPREFPVDGTSESLASIEVGHVSGFHDRMYCPRRATLAAVGDLAPEELFERAERSFEGWSHACEIDALPPVPQRQQEKRFRGIRMESSQVHLSLGNLSLSRRDPLYYAAAVLDVILGDSAGFGSRLSSALRERAGLAYVVESDASSSAGMEPGVFWTYAATSPDNVMLLLGGILEELGRMKYEPPTEDEIESAAAYLKGRRLVDLETAEARAGNLIHAERHGLGLDYEERYPEIISSVTRDDVAAAAQRVIDLDSYSLVAVGPLDRCPELLELMNGR